MSVLSRTSRPRTVSALAAARRRAAASSGFTIIEVLVATLVLTIGIVALITSFTSSQALGTSAEAHQTAAALAEAELERLHALSWEQLGLQAAPTRSGVSGNPTNYEVSPSTTTCTGKAALEINCYEWNWRETAVREPLVINPALPSEENPRTETVKVTTGAGSGTNLTFTVYHFVTWVNYAEGTGCGASECSATDPKRIVVAVTGSHLRAPVTLVTIVSNRETEKTPFKALSSPECEEEGGTKPSCLPAS